MSTRIRLLPSSEIHRDRWNEAVRDAPVYCQYDYLNLMCDHWSALVAGDYAGIVALPWRKRYGIRYLYEPAFIQQLGCVGAISLQDLQQLFTSFKYGDLLFNHRNTAIAAACKASQRTNLVIDLTNGYHPIASSYRKDLQQNLARAARHHLQVQEGNIEEVIALYRLLYHERFSNVREVDYVRFASLCNEWLQTGQCLVRRITNEQGELLSAGIFLKDSHRIYNMMNATTAAGRGLEANPFLLDAVIREFAGRNLVFDFEGSDIAGVKAFYEKFGAVEEPYFHLHYNRLPFPLRLLKR